MLNMVGRHAYYRLKNNPTKYQVLKESIWHFVPLLNFILYYFINASGLIGHLSPYIPIVLIFILLFQSPIPALLSYYFVSILMDPIKMLIKSEGLDKDNFKIFIGKILTPTKWITCK